MKVKNIAILIRAGVAPKIDIESIEHLFEGSVDVAVFLLGSGVVDPSWMERLDRPGLKRFSDRPGTCQAHGFQIVGNPEIARRITAADVVIPL